MLKSQIIFINYLVVVFSGLLLIDKIQASQYEAFQKCQNPNGRVGRCLSIYECPTILGIITKKSSPSYVFARQSECTNGWGRKPLVCCTIDTSFLERSQTNADRIIFPDEDNAATTPTTSRIAGRREDSELFPKPPICGPVSVANKIYGGDEAELGEFSWLANLEYRRPNGDLVSVCSGNILNKRYLLTAAHCVKGQIEQKIGKLVSVRIGDHNTNTELDCDNYGCSDPYQRLNVERTIVHPNFSRDKNEQVYNHHDIALIRTDRDMLYSFTVSPVCLPDVVTPLPELRTGMRLTVAGWGHNGTVKFTAEKRKVDVPYVPNSECPYKVAPEQLCAGGVFRRDSCTGDSGGSLTRLTSSGWIMEGIVSYGRGCGLETPAIYTRIRSYLPWIRNNVQA